MTHLMDCSKQQGSMLQPGGQRGISQQVCYELVSVKPISVDKGIGCKEEISTTSNHKHRTFIADW